MITAKLEKIVKFKLVDPSRSKPRPLAINLCQKGLIEKILRSLTTCVVFID
jgi:hypothetical protein